MNDLWKRFDIADLSARAVTRRSLLRYAAGAGLAAAILPLVAACGSGDDDDAAAAPTRAATSPATTTGSGAASTTTSGSAAAPTKAGGGAATTLTATLTNSSITLDPTSVPAGSVTVNVVNHGTMEHELVIIKTDMDPAQLKMNQSGTEVDEAASGMSPGELEGIEPSDSKTNTFDLEVGKYVLFCNIAGHYMAGMHASLEVV